MLLEHGAQLGVSYSELASWPLPRVVAIAELFDRLRVASDEQARENEGET